MLLFSRLFMETTDPLTPYSRLISWDTLVSILSHTIAYLVIFWGLARLCQKKYRPGVYSILAVFLVVLMSAGYYFRLQRVKSLYQVYLERGYSKAKARNDSINLLHQGYMTYYFLG